jgi:hypothetical protein
MELCLGIGLPHMSLLGGDRLEYMHAFLFKMSSEVSEGRLLFSDTGFSGRLTEHPWSRRGTDVEQLLPLLSWRFFLVSWPSLCIWDSPSILLFIGSLRAVSFAPRCWAFLAGNDSVELVTCPGTFFFTIPLFMPFRALIVLSVTRSSWATLPLEYCVEHTICRGTGGGV